MGQIRKQSISSSIIAYFGVMVGFIATGLVMPKIFSTEEIGIIKLIMSVSGLFASIFSLGVSQIIIKTFYDVVKGPNSYKKYVRFILRNLLIGGAIVLPIFLLTTEFTLDLSKIKLEFAHSTSFIIIVYLLILSRIYFIGLDAMLRIRKKVVISVFIQNFILKLYPLVVYVLFYLDVISFETSLILYISLYFILPFVLFILIKPSTYIENGTEEEVVIQKPNYLKIGMFGTLTTLGSALVLYIDTIMINKFLDENATGIYSVMFMFGLAISIPSKPLRSISQSMISEAFSKNEMQKVLSIYKKSCQSLFVVGSLIYLVVIINVPLLVDYLDVKYEVGVMVVFIIGLAHLIDMSTGVNSEILHASKYYWLGTPLTVVLIITTIVTNIILIPIYGITGAAIATLISLSLTNIIKLVMIFILFKFQPITLRMLLGVVLFVGMFLAQYFIEFADNLLINGIVESLVFAGGLLVLFYLFSVSSDVNGMINRIVYRVFKIKLTKD